MSYKDNIYESSCLHKIKLKNDQIKSEVSQKVGVMAVRRVQDETDEVMQDCTAPWKSPEANVKASLISGIINNDV